MTDTATVPTAATNPTAAPMFVPITPLTDVNSTGHRFVCFFPLLFPLCVFFQFCQDQFNSSKYPFLSGSLIKKPCKDHTRFSQVSMHDYLRR